MTLATPMTLLGSLILLYNTLGTASVNHNQYAFTGISCTHVYVLDHLAFDTADFLLHHGNGFDSFIFTEI